MSKLSKVIQYVQAQLETEKSGHDFLHAQRVAHLAEKIIQTDQLSVNQELVLSTAYLHDVIDDKVVLDVEQAVADLRAFLLSIDFSLAEVSEMLSIIQSMSFSKELSEGQQSLSLAGQIVQDADRLEALGAIGILRTAYYGGSKGHPIYDETMLPKSYETKADYRQGSTVINHFYEKLFLLPERMHTAYARQEGERRKVLMEAFLEEFYQEWRV